MCVCVYKKGMVPQVVFASINSIKQGNLGENGCIHVYG